MIGNIFNLILVKPLLNLLVGIYNVIPGHDFGVAIIILTILVRLILYPLAQSGIKSQKALSEIQPEIKALQKKYKDNKEKQSQELMKLYKEKHINPAGGCLPLLIQLPVLIALFQVLRKGVTGEGGALLYGFVSHPAAINPLFIGLINLGTASIVLAILAGITQFIQGKMLAPASASQGSGDKGDFSSSLNKQMVYTMPIFTLLIALRFPAGLSLYWVVSNVFTIFQQYLIISKKQKDERARN